MVGLVVLLFLKKSQKNFLHCIRDKRNLACQTPRIATLWTCKKWSAAARTFGRNFSFKISKKRVTHRSRSHFFRPEW